MAYDYSKLKGKIVEVFGTQKNFSKAMGWSERTMSLKLNGSVFWKQDEITTAMNLLSISAEDVRSYFFVIVAQTN